MANAGPVRSMLGHCVVTVRLLSPGSRRNPAAYLVPTVCYGPGSSNRDFTCWCAGRKCNFAFDLLSPLSSEDENVVPHSFQSLPWRNAISRCYQVVWNLPFGLKRAEQIFTAPFEFLDERMTGHHSSPAFIKTHSECRRALSLAHAMAFRAVNVKLIVSLFRFRELRQKPLFQFLLGVFSRSIGFVCADRRFLCRPIHRSEERRVGKECRSRWSP